MYFDEFWRNAETGFSLSSVGLSEARLPAVTSMFFLILQKDTIANLFECISSFGLLLSPPILYK